MGRSIGVTQDTADHRVRPVSFMLREMAYGRFCVNE